MRVEPITGTIICDPITRVYGTPEEVKKWFGEEPVEPQHHRYSASGYEGWATCAGKLVMEDGIKEEYKPYADQGSAAHFLASECLTRNKNPSDFHHFGIVCWEQEGGRDGQSWYSQKSKDDSAAALPEGCKERSRWKVDAEMVEAVTRYTDYVRSQVKGGTLLVEQRVRFGHAIGLTRTVILEDGTEVEDGDAFGTSDLLILSEDGKELLVADLKYGFTEVSAKNNGQMMLYALGALADEQVEMQLVVDAGKAFEEECLKSIALESPFTIEECLQTEADHAKELAEDALRYEQTDLVAEELAWEDLC